MSDWKQQACERFSMNDSAPKWSRMYDQPTERLEEENFRLRRDFTVELITRRLQPGAAIVDVGCGAAPVLTELFERGYPAVGLDAAPDMLALARQRLAAIGGDPDVLLEGDITRLPFDDASMDCVVCLGVLSYVPDPGQALREIHRILRPGGFALISYRNRYNRLLSDPVVAIRQLLRQRRQPPKIGQFLDPRTVQRQVAAAGLRLESIEAIGLGPFRLAQRSLMSEARAIRLSRRLSQWADRLRLQRLKRRLCDVHVLVCSRP